MPRKLHRGETVIGPGDVRYMWNGTEWVKGGKGKWWWLGQVRSGSFHFLHKEDRPWVIACFVIAGILFVLGLTLDFRNYGWLMFVALCPLAIGLMPILNPHEYS